MVPLFFISWIRSGRGVVGSGALFASQMIRFGGFLLLLTASLSSAQTPSPVPTMVPPRDTSLVEKKWEQIDQSGISADGQVALKIAPEKWKHAETPNFIIHYRRATEAKKVAREVEFDLVVIANTLHAPPASYSRKSHIYVFEDTTEWANFVSETAMPEWTASFAYGDELFLNIREDKGGTFDSSTLAHETTHAVVSRIHPGERWPLWLNEGFAEYMSSAAVAQRKNQLLGRHQRKLENADFPLEQLTALEHYPDKLSEVSQLYQTSEKLVRFLFAANPPERFVRLADALAHGTSLPDAVAAIYGDKYPTFADFEKAYNKFAGEN